MIDLAFMSEALGKLIAGVPLTLLGARAWHEHVAASIPTFTGVTKEVPRPKDAMPGPYPGRVIEVLSRLVSTRGAPTFLRSDNGSEFVSKALLSWIVAQGIGMWLGAQALINMGVNMGLLPTKGLTLPLLSFGGTGIVVNCVALAILLRIDWENRHLMRGGSL